MIQCKYSYYTAVNSYKMNWWNKIFYRFYIKYYLIKITRKPFFLQKFSHCVLHNSAVGQTFNVLTLYWPRNKPITSSATCYPFRDFMLHFWHSMQHKVKLLTSLAMTDHHPNAKWMCYMLHAMSRDSCCTFDKLPLGTPFNVISYDAVWVENWTNHLPNADRMKC